MLSKIFPSKRTELNCELNAFFLDLYIFRSFHWIRSVMFPLEKRFFCEILWKFCGKFLRSLCTSWADKQCFRRKSSILSFILARKLELLSAKKNSAVWHFHFPFLLSLFSVVWLLCCCLLNYVFAVACVRQ